jgi:hypothetical protein
MVCGIFFLKQVVTVQTNENGKLVPELIFKF